MESIKISHASLDRGQALRRLRNADWLVANGPNTGVDSDSNMQPLHADREFVRQELDVNDVRHFGNHLDASRLQHVPFDDPVPSTCCVGFFCVSCNFQDGVTLLKIQAI